MTNLENNLQKFRTLNITKANTKGNVWYDSSEDKLVVLIGWNAPDEIADRWYDLLMDELGMSEDSDFEIMAECSPKPSQKVF